VGRNRLLEVHTASEPVQRWPWSGHGALRHAQFIELNGEGKYTDAATGTKHNGYYVATSFGESFSLGLHPGEDWNGKGGGNTDLGRPVHSVAAGRVAVAENAGPQGMYFVIAPHRGAFSGEFADYYGGHWLKINYPNRYDAAWGARDVRGEKT
jgi:hypothetical protein